MTAELPQPQPTDAVIVGGARTPFTRLLSQQADLRAVDLGAHAITHALERAGVAPEDVDMVYMGQVVQAGAGQNPARQSALAAGIPWNVPAMTINKVCLSGLTAVIDAARLIRLGEADVVVAGGQESMTNAPHLLPGARKGFKYGPATMLDAVAWDGLTDSLSHEAMGELTESGNGERNIARAEQDEVAAGAVEQAHREGQRPPGNRQPGQARPHRSGEPHQDGVQHAGEHGGDRNRYAANVTRQEQDLDDEQQQRVEHQQRDDDAVENPHRATAGPRPAHPNVARRCPGGTRIGS